MITQTQAESKPRAQRFHTAVTGARILRVVGLVGVMAGCAALCVSLFTRYWMTSDSKQEHIGLFSGCAEQRCGPLFFRSTESGDKAATQFLIVRCLAITGTVLSGLGLLLSLVTTIGSCRGAAFANKCSFVAIVANVFAGLSAVAGAAVFAVTFYRDMKQAAELAAYGEDTALGYSFILCCAGGGASLLFGLAVFLGGSRGETRPTQHIEAETEEEPFSELPIMRAKGVRSLSITSFERTPTPPTYRKPSVQMQMDEAAIRRRDSVV